MTPALIDIAIFPLLRNLVVSLCLSDSEQHTLLVGSWGLNLSLQCQAIRDSWDGQWTRYSRPKAPQGKLLDAV